MIEMLTVEEKCLCLVVTVTTNKKGGSRGRQGKAKQEVVGER